MRVCDFYQYRLEYKQQKTTPRGLFFCGLKTEFSNVGQSVAATMSF